jgi:hypothetical protein
MGTLKEQAMLLRESGIDIQKANYLDRINLASDYALDVNALLIVMADEIDALTVRVDRLTAYADEDDGGRN